MVTWLEDPISICSITGRPLLDTLQRAGIWGESTDGNSDGLGDQVL